MPRMARQASSSRRTDSGASMVEYALLAALLVLAVLGAIQYLTDEGSDELADRGGRLGAPDLAATPTSSTTAVTVPPGGGGGGEEPDPPGELLVGPLSVCRTSTSTPARWGATVTFSVTDPDGAPLPNMDVSLQVVIDPPSGATSVQTSTSSADGTVVVSRQGLSVNGNNDQGIQFTILSVAPRPGAPEVTYQSPIPPPSISITRTGLPTC